MATTETPAPFIETPTTKFEAGVHAGLEQLGTQAAYEFAPECARWTQNTSWA
jgi:hypothetical protein